MTTSHGPFDTSAAALATEAARDIREQVRSITGDGFRGIPAAAPAVEYLVAECHRSGVELGKADMATIIWIAGGELASVISVAGIIRRAHEAGRAAR